MFTEEGIQSARNTEKTVVISEKVHGQFERSPKVRGKYQDSSGWKYFGRKNQ